MRGTRVSLTVVITLLILLSFSNPSNADQTVTTVVTTVSKSTFSMSLTCPADSPPEGEPFGFGGNSTQYETYDIEMFFVICGQYVQYGRISIAVLYAWINRGDYQNATSLSFSFDSAHYWLNSTQKCNLAVYPAQPAIQLHLIRNASRPGEVPYKPPVYAGQGELCFAFPADYRPVFIVNLPNQAPIQIHQAASETPYRLHIAPQAATQNTSSQSTTTQTVTQTTQTSSTSQEGSFSIADLLKNPLTYAVGGIVLALTIIQLYFGSIREFVKVLGSPKERGKVIQELKQLRKREEVKKKEKRKAQESNQESLDSSL